MGNAGNGRKGKGRPLAMGYEEALALVLKWVEPVREKQTVGLAEAMGRVLFKDLYSTVDSPSIDASTKDGYALCSEDIRTATPQTPVGLRVIGTAAAGGDEQTPVSPGTAVRILTGGRVPQGADAVLAEEFATLSGDRISVFNTAEPGRNILPKGTDVRTNELVIPKGSRLTPGMIAMAAAAGLGELTVYQRPKVAILATGDELVAPGRPLAKGQLYASNLEMLKAWCLKLGLESSCLMLDDRPDLITQSISELVEIHDALLTSGGAWTGDRDFLGMTLETLGWDKKFHSIRIGPGKPVGFGLLGRKPVSLLPGGPPSNLTAFLQIALPGLMRLAGNAAPVLPRVAVTLNETVASRHRDWTQFIYGRLKGRGSHTLFIPLTLKSRLKSIAGAEAVVAVPEGIDSFHKGAVVEAQLLI